MLLTLLLIWVGLLGVTIAITDARTHRIPNELLILWAASIVLATVIGHDWAALRRSLLLGAGMLACGVFLGILQPRGFGAGDAKLFGCVGMTLGYQNPAIVLMWGVAFVAASWIWLLLARWLDGRYDRTVPLRSREVAAGPAIIAALVASIVLGYA